MKKNQNNSNPSTSKTTKNRSFLRMLKRFYGIKGNFSFAIFQFLKTDSKKLQIIYANIRV
jgi:hypothetical protein